MSEVELPLTYTENPKPPRRPKTIDKRVERAAAQAAAEKILKQWDWEGNFEEGDIEALMDVIHEWDGYKACRRLQDRYFWDPDSALVEILSYPFRDIAWNDAVVEWVLVNGIKPKLQIGATVTCRYGTGTITRIDEKTAHYLVQIEKAAYVMDYEAVSLISEPSA